MHSNKDLIRFGSKAFILTAAVIVILGSVISSTIAWMFIKSGPVNNTFTYGGISLELTETDTKDDDGNDNTNRYSLTPEAVIAKDPEITVKAGSEACWLFVKIDESDNFDSLMTYGIADGWTKLEDGIYYRKVQKSADDQKLYVLAGNVVTVRDDVTQEMLNNMEAADFPILKFTAYAVQLEGIDDAEAAWEAINK